MDSIKSDWNFSFSADDLPFKNELIAPILPSGTILVFDISGVDVCDCNEAGLLDPYGVPDKYEDSKPPTLLFICRGVLTLDSDGELTLLLSSPINLRPQ
ncbi:hypothetical protein WICMUC_004719 [Wickerhamomyces mucosus]|uniref:Uncharacterized protein n=1 Tax=Wickerhamomyces mucosus TaxID=1378264 RepID=A0A9P8PH68_9ASCO|nr:hypothetical protein WICMUC_004719 [Wickerhamomyces mucosus]